MDLRKRIAAADALLTPEIRAKMQEARVGTGESICISQDPHIVLRSGRHPLPENVCQLPGTEGLDNDPFKPWLWGQE